MMGWFVRKVERLFAAKTDANFQADAARAEFFAKQYRLPQPRTLSNCPTLQELPRTNRLREAAGLGPDDRILVYSGIVGPGRGVQPTLAALELLPENVHMVFLSYGMTQWITEFQETLPHGHRCHLVPPVPYDEVVPTVSSADVGLSLIQNTNLSYYLGVPNKLFEYMMAGIPAVGSDFPEISRVINDAEFGLTVDPENPEQIAEAVQRLLNDEALHRQCQENACRSRKKYCWENQVSGLLEVYRELAAKRT